MLHVGSEAPSRANAGQQHPLLVTGCHYTHIHRHTHIHYTHRHTDTHTLHTHTDTHRHTDTDTHTLHIHTDTQTHIHTQTHTYPHTDTTHTHRQTHYTYTQTHTHYTHRHTHTHAHPGQAMLGTSLPDPTGACSQRRYISSAGIWAQRSPLPRV